MAICNIGPKAAIGEHDPFGISRGARSIVDDSQLDVYKRQVVGRPLSVFLCLLPFGKRITLKSRLFVSWVGLRGAVPIIFATYPVVANVPGAHVIFNIVFFITIVSLVIQGTTVSWVARLLGLSTPLEKTGNDFGVELPEEIDSNLSLIHIFLQAI